MDENLCPDAPYRCVCMLVEGHDEPHACECGGSWVYEDGQFTPVTMPDITRSWMFSGESLADLLPAMVAGDWDDG